MRGNRSYLILIQVRFKLEAKFDNLPFWNELIGCPRNLLGKSPLLYKKQKSLMPWIVLFSDWNYFLLTRQVSARANQHKAEIFSILLMRLQKQSKLFNNFHGSEWELLNFRLILYVPVVVTELRNEGFQIKFDCGWRFFDKILMLLWLFEV